MSPWAGFDPEEERLQAAAGLLLHRIALALIDDARKAGGFGADQGALDKRIAELVDELADGQLTSQSAEHPVEATLAKPNQIELSVAYDESHATFAVLRSDGVLLEQGGMVGITAEFVGESELPPEELERMNELHATLSKPQFTGKRFLRALRAKPQPDSETQLLAIELFDDGLLVHYTFNEDGDPTDAIREDPLAWPMSTVAIQLEDDLGTDYYTSGGGEAGGVNVIYSAAGFAPAVPEGASVLRVELGGRAIELAL